MNDLTDNERVTHEIDILTAALEKQPTSPETTAQTAAAFKDYILQRERIRRDVTAPGLSQDAVDAETLKTLQNAQLDDPKHAEAEAVFRRFGDSPTEAIGYLERMISDRRTELSDRMSAVSSKPRPGGRKPFSKIIDEIVETAPRIDQNELLQKLKKHENIYVLVDQIYCRDPHDVMTVDALRGALSRSKKRKWKKSR